MAHKDVLTKVKFFAACLNSSFRESKDRHILLPEEEPEVFEKILEYLYRGSIEAKVFAGLEDADLDYWGQETDYTLLMGKVWVAADKYCMEECQNQVMDYFLRYCRWRWISPLLISELSKRGLRECLLRKLAMSDVALKSFSPKPIWNASIGVHAESMKLLDAGGIDAQDVFQACVQWMKEGRYDKKAFNPCAWHVHNFTKKCSSQTLKEWENPGFVVRETAGQKWRTERR